MSKRTRRNISAEKKADLIRQHLGEKKAVSAICEENDIQPSMFYTWMKQLLANAPAAFSGDRKRQAGGSREAELEAENERLRARLARKDAVIAEVSEELVKSKKENGDL